jgi:hypothetical protein
VAVAATSAMIPAKSILRVWVFMVDLLGCARLRLSAAYAASHPETISFSRYDLAKPLHAQ